jgi:predicted DsbA family dithiol-disulfide isomerase
MIRTVRAPSACGIFMARIVIPIYFDYASTLCYVAWRIVGELEAELGFEALWKGVPIALRDRRAKGGRGLSPLERQKIAMVAAETGIPVTPPEAWLDSTPALEGAELAREAGAFRAFHDAVFRAAFEERRDIARAEVLDEIAERAGLDRARFRAGLDSRRMAGRIEAHKREADAFSALGYPTFMLGDFPLTGIQPIDTMRMMLARFMERRRNEPQA